MKSPPMVKGAGSSEHLRSYPLTPNPSATATNFRRFEKNTLRAFVDIELPDGLILRGCTLHFNERWWLGFPARPYKDADGNDTWARIVDFSSKEARDRFQRLAFEAAMAAYEAAK